MSSDTTAFLAGCAISGVAVVMFLGNRAEVTPPQVVPSGAPAPAVVTPTAAQPLSSDPNAEQTWQFRRQFEQQEATADDLKAQIAQQQQQSEKLQAQLQQQQEETQKIVTQLQDQVKDQQKLIESTLSQQQQSQLAEQIRAAELNQQDRLADQLREQLRSEQLAAGQLRPVPEESADPKLQTTLLWIAGAILLVLISGGAVVSIWIIILLAQLNRRPARTMQVIRPMSPSPSAVPRYPLTHQPMLPPVPRTRRVEQIEFYED